jgi:hypothetical protein
LRSDQVATGEQSRECAVPLVSVNASRADARSLFSQKAHSEFPCR